MPSSFQSTDIAAPDIPAYSFIPSASNQTYENLPPSQPHREQGTSNISVCIDLDDDDSDGFIDLTGDPSSPPSYERDDVSQREPRAPKRRRLNPEPENEIPQNEASSSTQEAQPPAPAAAAEVDLTGVENEEQLEEHARKEKEAEAKQDELLKQSVDAQQEAKRGPTRLSGLSCVICMDNITELTATHCGHIFCHTCIMEALIAGENQCPDTPSSTGKCPVCRKKVARVRRPNSKELPQVIPLQLKLQKKEEKTKA